MYKKEQREKIQEAILESFAKGASVVKACNEANITWNTFYKWRRSYKRFDKKVVDVLNSRTQVVEDALFKSALGGNVVAQIFWLKNRASDRWKDRYNQEISGNVEFVVKLPDDKN